MLWEDNQCLVHYGIIGQRWGIRRYQNKDGSLTPEGKKRYGYSVDEVEKSLEKAKEKSIAARNDYYNAQHNNALNIIKAIKTDRAWAKAVKEESKLQKMFNRMPERIQRDIDRDKEIQERWSDTVVGNIGDISKPHMYAVSVVPDVFGLSRNDVIKAYEKETPNVSKSSKDIIDKDLNNPRFSELNYNTQVYINKRQIENLQKLSEGKDRDSALTEYMRTHTKDHNNSGLISLAMDKSGDFLDGISETESNRKAYDRVRKAEDFARSISKNHPEYISAQKNVKSAYEKYCETVLKDMGMPVNDKTMLYVKAIIYWN